MFCFEPRDIADGRLTRDHAPRLATSWRRLAGGEGGMAHMLDHFGPSLEAPWTRLAAPPLTDALRGAVVEGCDEEAGGRSVDDLVRERDRGLVALLKALREAGVGTPGGD